MTYVTNSDLNQVSAKLSENQKPPGTLEIRNICKAFPNVIALKNVSLDIRPGEVLAFVGENGAGKSTLLKMMSGLIFPQQGIFKAYGQEINEQRMEDDAFSQKYHLKVGYIFQNSEVQLFTTRVWDEIAYGPLQMGFTTKVVKQRVEDVLEMFLKAYRAD